MSNYYEVIIYRMRVGNLEFGPFSTRPKAYYVMQVAAAHYFPKETGKWNSDLDMLDFKDAYISLRTLPMDMHYPKFLNMGKQLKMTPPQESGQAQFDPRSQGIVGMQE